MAPEDQSVYGHLEICKYNIRTRDNSRVKLESATWNITEVKQEN